MRNLWQSGRCSISTRSMRSRTLSRPAPAFALRTASGRALLQLWKGKTVDLGIDESWLDDLVERLRQHVQVCEVEAVALGEVPSVMLGWWIPPALASQFELDSTQPSRASEDEGEDDEEFA